MPNYKNAADVRAQHPGVYDDLTDQQIEQGLAKTAASNPADDGALGERYHPNSADTPTSAFLGELARTGKEAAIGLARSPWDAVKGLVGLPQQAIKGLVQDLPQLVADPSLLTELPGAVRDGVMDLAQHPREAGSLLGQTLLAPKIPGAANAVLREGPSVVGRGMGAVGRGMEAVGTSKLAKRGGTYGALTELATGHPAAAAVTAVIPPALEYGGKGFQKLGGSLEGLDLSFKGRTPVPEATVPESRRLNPARFSTEVPNYGKQLDAIDGPGSWERSPSDNPLVPGRRNGAVSVQGLEDAAKDSAWAGDKSAAPLDSRISSLSPIEEFYKNDPQARGVGGNSAEGRMTGQFREGNGGLADAAAGRLARYDAPAGTKPAFTHEGFLKDLQGSVDAGAGAAQPSPLDELSRLSGRALAPEEIQRLLDRFKGWEPE